MSGPPAWGLGEALTTPPREKYQGVVLKFRLQLQVNWPFKYEAQTASFKDPVLTAL